MNVGEHCSIIDCRTLDLLPFLCPACTLLHCRNHATPDQHACVNNPSVNVSDPNRFKDKFNDLLPDRSLNPVLAQREHEAIEKADKRAAAAALIAKSFGSGTTRSNQTSSSSSSSAAAAITTRKPKNAVIELMKLKQRSKPGDPRKKPGDVPVEARIYLVAHLMVNGAAIESKEIWLPKETTVGKSLDLLATCFRIENVNNSSSDPNKILAMYLDSSPTQAINSHKLDGYIENGGTLYLARGHFEIRPSP